MPFNPLSNRDPDKTFDETDWFGATLLLGALLLLAALCAMKVKLRENELKYLQQNNCKVEVYDVRNTYNSKMTLWDCNSKHYISE